MSLLVKQDLARLDKDGESRQCAMSSLKQFVDNLDPGSMPRFLAQVSQTPDQRVSRSYAISLYEEVARVHGKLIIPHISRVMATITRSLSSSGSSPQLHQACAKVISAVARFSVEEGSPEKAGDILRELCDPLLSVLAGKLEPLAAGAAVCLQALVECEKWKYASDEIIRETCLQTTIALKEKNTRTVAHMQLARSLATTNPSFFDGCGVALLRSVSEVLRRTSASGTWQQRACAARLLQALLPIVDKTTLVTEMEYITDALEECKHDRMAHVRAAVSEALKTAEVLISHDCRVSSDGLSFDSRPLSACSSLGKAGTQVRLRPAGFGNPHPSLCGKIGYNQQSIDTADGSSFVMPPRREGRDYNHGENSATTAHWKQEGADRLEEEVSSNGTVVDIEVETDIDSYQGLLTKESRYNQVGGSSNDNAGLVSSSRFSHMQTLPTGPRRKSVGESEGRAGDSRNQSVGIVEYLHDSSGVILGHDCKEDLDFVCEQQSMPPLRGRADVSSPQKQAALITAEDFLRFSTPRRLVRSLQSNLSSPLGSCPTKNKVTNAHGVNLPDMDFESSSEVGWSVRDSPIASDGSLKTGSEGKKRGQQGNICEKMLISSSTRLGSTGFDTKIVPARDFEKLSSAIVHATGSLFCLGTKKAPEHKSFKDNEETLNDELDPKLQDFSFSPAHYQGGLLGMLKEHCPSECTCCGKTSGGTHFIESGGHLVARDEQGFEILSTSKTQRDGTIGVLWKSFLRFLGHIFGNFLRSMQACTEALLTVFLLFILAVPFAVVIKTLWSHLDRPGLIPT